MRCWNHLSEKNGAKKDSSKTLGLALWVAEGRTELLLHSPCSQMRWPGHSSRNEGGSLSLSSWHYLKKKKENKQQKNPQQTTERSLSVLLFDWGNKSLAMKGKSFYLPPKAANLQSKALPGAFLEASCAPWVTSLSLLEPGRAVRVPSTSELWGGYWGGREVCAS